MKALVTDDSKTVRVRWNSVQETLTVPGFPM
jgi:hypothetical protein